MAERNFFKIFFCCGKVDWRRVQQYQYFNSVKTVRKEKAMTEKQIPKFVAMLVEHQAYFAGLPTEDTQWAIQNTPEAIALMVKAIAARNNGDDLSEEATSFLKKLTASGPLILDAV